MLRSLYCGHLSIYKWYEDSITSTKCNIPLSIDFGHLKKYLLKDAEAASSLLSSLQKQKRARCLGGSLLA